MDNGVRLSVKSYRRPALRLTSSHVFSIYSLLSCQQTHLLKVDWWQYFCLYRSVRGAPQPVSSHLLGPPCELSNLV